MEKDKLVEKICDRILDKGLIQIEISARHVHLSKDTLEALFGESYELNYVRELSQKGQYLCKERVDITGPDSTIRNIAILGPCRKSTQLEISKGDARKLGIDVPIRLSGSTLGSAPFTISVGYKSVDLPEGAIIAKRHIHVPPSDAKRLNLSHKEVVSIKILSDDRPLTFENTIVRIDEKAGFTMHLDTEEANAAGISRLGYGIICKNE